MSPFKHPTCAACGHVHDYHVNLDFKRIPCDARVNAKAKCGCTRFKKKGGGR